MSGTPSPNDSDDNVPGPKHEFPYKTFSQDATAEEVREWVQQQLDEADKVEPDPPADDAPPG
jgi:hypothetical protein